MELLKLTQRGAIQGLVVCRMLKGALIGGLRVMFAVGLLNPFLGGRSYCKCLEESYWSWLFLDCKRDWSGGCAIGKEEDPRVYNSFWIPSSVYMFSFVWHNRGGGKKHNGWVGEEGREAGKARLLDWYIATVDG